MMLPQSRSNFRSNQTLDETTNVNISCLPNT